jgi:hypothetical protein
MTLEASRLRVTAEARVRARLSPCGICGGRNGIGTSFSPSLVFPCQYHSTGAPYSYNLEDGQKGPLEAAVKGHSLTP